VTRARRVGGCRGERPKSGQSSALKTEPDDLFNSQNRSAVADPTVIPATYLRVTVSR
jgi:hypothetical protein